MAVYDQIDEEEYEDELEDTEGETDSDEEDRKFEKYAYYRALTKSSILDEDQYPDEAAAEINREFRAWIKSQKSSVMSGTSTQSNAFTDEEIAGLRALLANQFTAKELLVLKNLVAKTMNLDLGVVTKPIAPPTITVKPVMAPPAKIGPTNSPKPKPKKKKDPKARLFKTKEVNMPAGHGTSETVVPTKRARLPGFAPVGRTAAEIEAMSLEMSMKQVAGMQNKSLEEISNSPGGAAKLQSAPPEFKG